MSNRPGSPGNNDSCPRCGLRHRGDDSLCPAQAVGKTIAGRFHVVRLIGAGGTAAVYKAQNLAIGRFVAIKILHPHLRSEPAAVERFVREGRAMSRVRHEGVVDVLDFVTNEEGAPMLVLEYVRARSLASELRRNGAMAVPRAMELVGQLLATLSAVHARGLVHRDLKPANVLVGVDTRRRERLKLADFGLAVEINTRRNGRVDRVRVTPPGRVLATPRYLAPELLRGGDGHDVRVDVYGVGLVLYEMLAGRPAFESSDMDELADAILNAQPPSAAAVRKDVSPQLDQVIARALSKRPGERFPSVVAMLEALRPLGATSEVIEAEPTDTGLLEAPRGLQPEGARARPVSSPAAAPTPQPTSDAGAERPAHPHSVFPRPGVTDQTDEHEVSGSGASGPRLAPPSLPQLASLGDGEWDSAATPPLVADISAASAAHASSASDGLARGSIAATLLSAVRRQYGEARVAALTKTLPAVTQATLSGPMRDDDWVPSSAMTLLLEAADAHLGRGDGALCIGFGRLVARTLLPQAHGEMLREATPEAALIEVGTLWRRYFEIGELRAPAVGRGYGKLELRNHVPRRSSCLALGGFVEVLLELAGARDVEIVIPTCCALGDASCTFDANWMF